MFKKKSLSSWAILMAIVFAIIIILYPTIFNTDDESVPPHPTPVQPPPAPDSVKE